MNLLLAVGTAVRNDRTVGMGYALLSLRPAPDMNPLAAQAGEHPRSLRDARTRFGEVRALPQFYFHVGMTYAILRSHGVPLGKADYVPHMFAYLRSGGSG